MSVITGILVEQQDGSYRAEIDRGSTLEPVEIEFESEDFLEGETDISGYDFRFQVRKNKNDSAAVIDLSVGSGITKTSNKIVIAPTPAQFNIPGGAYFGDLKITTASGRVYKILKCVFAIKDTATR